MRVYLLYGLILVAMALSTRRWVFGIYVVIVLSALSQHDDMPRSMAGITGLNPINVLMAWILLMFAIQRSTTPKVAKSLPTSAVVLLVFYAVTIVVVYLQGLADLGSLQGPLASSDIATIKGFTIEFLINPFKVLLPAWLLYQGMRTQKDLWIGLAALGLMALLLAVIVLKNLPLGTLFDESAFMARRHRIQRQTGLHANDLALVMVQACWVAALALRLRMRIGLKAVIAGCLVAFGLAVALCHSRAGFLAFVLTGLVLSAVCWRRLLVVLPLVIVAVAAASPTIRARVLTGSAVQDLSGGQTQDWEAISAGRTVTLWPHALAQIEEAPILGAGRLTILRTDMFERIEESSGDACPTHPHNAYLETLCDGGAVSLLVLLAGMMGLGSTALRMCRRKDSAVVAFVGALGLVAVVPLMVMGISGQSFWPRENMFPAACLIAILLRAWTLLAPRVSREAARGTLGPGRAAVPGT